MFRERYRGIRNLFKWGICMRSIEELNEIVNDILVDYEGFCG